MKIGIIGTIDEKISKLKSGIKDLKIKKIQGIIFYTGLLKGKNIVLVKSKPGKINASVCVNLLIVHFKVNKVIFTGLEGELNSGINVGDIVISTELIHHEFDTALLDSPYGIMPRMTRSIFKADSNLVHLAKEVAYEEFGEEKVWLGRILGGDQLSGNLEKVKWLRDTFSKECIEIEGVAIAHVCHLLKIPFVILSHISDKTDNMRTDNIYSTELMANNTKILVEKILDRV